MKALGLVNKILIFGTVGLVACSSTSSGEPAQTTFNPATITVAGNQNVDTNGDGVNDGVLVDLDNDGVADIVVLDADGDGIGDSTTNVPVPGSTTTVMPPPGSGTAGAPPATSNAGAPPVTTNGGATTIVPQPNNGGAATAQGGMGNQAGMTSMGGTPMAMAGAANNGGQASMAGSGSGGAGMGPGMGASMGCGNDPLEPERMYVTHELTVPVDPEYQAQYTNRRYFTYLPANYDPNKPYPLVFYGAGCGASSAEVQPAMSVFNDSAILVFLLQVEGCFDAGSSGMANTPDIPYFDMALNEIKGNYCVDESRVFMSGYSSGAWFSITLSCSHGDQLRAIAVAAGGQQPQLPECHGQTAALFFVSSNDGGNPVAGATGSGVARDRLLAANGCADTTTQWDARWPYCQLYSSGCEENPVVWCDHMGGHSNGQPEGMATDGWWKFFTELP